MARDILAIPGCAVSAESAFDSCDQRVEVFKGKFRPETAEALVCAQSWIKSSVTYIGYFQLLWERCAVGGGHRRKGRRVVASKGGGWRQRLAAAGG
uniref:HAT C-terminal dimerisation domain-containing protein n=1 Tax=Oryza barthii TaxID=65489 RepID=A0A0D3GX93_9ORYZ